MKKIKNLLKAHTRQIIIGVVATGMALLLLWFRLGSLTYGNVAHIEQVTRQASSYWGLILNNPLNAPYTVLAWLVGLIGHHGVTSLRLVSTVYAAMAALLFYLVAKQWHSNRIALLGSWLFVSSSWFLHTGRLGTPEILWLTSILAIVALLTPNRDGRQTRWALPSTVLPLSAVLYVPGVVWLLLAGLLLQRKNVREAWQATSSRKLRIVSIAGSVALLLPLGYGFLRSPSLVKSWLGLIGTGSYGLPPIDDILQNLLSVPKSLLWNGTFDPVHWLHPLALLSAFEIIMFLAGLYFYGSHLRAARSRMIIVLGAIGWVLVGLLGETAISLIVPIVYLLVASGIAYILHRWLKVFPNNPIARGIGIAAILLAVLLTSIYQTRCYFVAWRYNSETRQVFHSKLE